MAEYTLPDKFKPPEQLLELYHEKKEAGNVGVITEGGKGNIPILFARGKGLAEAWENSMINLWINGMLLRTQYDKKDKGGNFIDPPSRDSTMIISIEDPLSEPMIHNAFPGGYNDLEEYRQEVIDGIKDHWIRDQSNPDDHRWEYTYHERFASFSVPGLEGVIDQFETMAQAIAKSPITRRSQLSSWKVWEDNGISDPACWQSYWGRIMRDSAETGLYSDDSGTAYLNINQRFRSRDAYDAAFMNDFAFIHLAKSLANRISKIRGEEVKLGRFMDQSDSYHIYGSRFENFNELFLKLLFKRPWTGDPYVMPDEKPRTIDSGHELAQSMFEEAKVEVAMKIKKKDDAFAAGQGLTKDATQLFKE